jgi:hypothetical protein
MVPLALKNNETSALEGKKSRVCNLVLRQEYQALGACLRPTKIYPICNDTLDELDQETQKADTCRLLPLEHRVRTHSIHPTGEDIIPKKQQLKELTK